MTAEEILAYIQSKEGQNAAREFLSGAQRIDAMVALKLARADQLRARARQLPALDAEAQQALREMEDEILADYNVLLKRQKQIGDAIRRVPEEVSRAVLESRYLQGLPFFRIAMNLNYDERQIYRYHQRGLQHIAGQLAAKMIPDFFSDP
ncbi:MAG: hypothetical protein IJ662_00055 [Clostridia bacterium]|nr:hypothetical protein [Clostridia bacterium]